ncbi:MAG: TRAP transporter small permease [Gammaproteobacteria bacterium]
MDIASVFECVVRAGHHAAKLPSALAAASLFLLMVMTFCDVMLRSVLNDPIEAATELTRILMAIIVFAALPIVSARGEHIVVDLTDGMFKGLARRLRNAMVDLACGALLIWPARRCFVLAARAREYGDLTEYLAIPQFYIAYFVAFATATTAGVLLARGAIAMIAPGLLEARTASSRLPE